MRVVIFYKVAMNIELVSTEPLLLGKIQLGSCKPLVAIYIFLSLFILKDRESVSGEEAEREKRARIPSRLSTSAKPMRGLNPQTMRS